MDDEVFKLRERVRGFLREAHDHDNLVAFDLPVADESSVMVLVEELQREGWKFEDQVREDVMGPYSTGRCVLGKQVPMFFGDEGQSGRVVTFRFHFRRTEMSGGEPCL